MKKVDNNIEKEIIYKYINDNLSCKTIGDIYKLSPTTIFNILKRNNIKLRTNGGIDQLPIYDIYSYYKKGIPVKEIADMFNVNEKTIYNYLNNYNIEINYNYKNPNLNNNYFKFIDTYDKAYFLGFLITDGNVFGNQVRLCLQSSDYKILEILSEKINNINPLYYYNTDTRNEVALHFKSPELVQDLAQYGVIPNKTDYVYLPDIDIYLMSHLIRGLIDGDGWISYKSHNIGFCGNYQLVSQLRGFLIYLLNVYPVKIIKTEEKIYQIQWSSKRDILAIGEYIYMNKNDCFLSRKYNNFMRIPR